jgi:hypothetical protein
MPPLVSEESTGLGFEQVVRHAPVAIAVVDASGRVLHSNERAQEPTRRQLGYAMPADLDGTTVLLPAALSPMRQEGG